MRNNMGQTLASLHLCLTNNTHVLFLTPKHLTITRTINSPVMQQRQPTSALKVMHFTWENYPKAKCMLCQEERLYCQGKEKKVKHTLTRAHPALLLQTSAGTIRPQACLGWWFDKLALSSRRCALCQCVRVYLDLWVHACVCASAWVHCLSCEVFGFLTEGCCHSLWKRVIGAHSPGMNAHPYTSEKMWHFKKTRDNRTEKWWKKRGHGNVILFS